MLSNLRWLLLLLLLVFPAAPVRSHAGHGDEFHATPSSASTVSVDPETQARLGLRVETVQKQPLAMILEASGELLPLPDQQTEVTMPVGGQLLRLLVQQGDTVRRGQPLAIIASPELAELRTSAFDRQSEALMNLREAEAELRLAQQNLSEQQRIVAADIQSARTTVRAAQERFDRDRELLAQGAIPRRELLATEEQLAAAKAVLAKAESQLPISAAHAQLQRAQAQVAVARDRLRLSQQTYRTRLQQLGTTANADGTMTVTAPIAGTVVSQVATLGEASEDAGKPLFRIVNSQRLQVVGYINEGNRRNVALGQVVEVHINGEPNQFMRSRIDRVDSVVDAGTQRTIVRATLDNPDQRLKPGMFVTLKILDDQQQRSALMIPQTAVVSPPDRSPVVFVQNGTAFEPVEVILGQRLGHRVEVVKGLFDGDRVVTEGAMQLYAQSLRGDTSAIEPDSEIQTLPLPWGWLIIGSSATAVALFAAGMHWQKQRSRLTSTS